MRALGLALVLFALTTDFAAAQTQHVIVCGRVGTYTAATATNPGSLTVGSRTFVVAAGTAESSVNAPIRVGTAQCISGERSANGNLSAIAASAFPPSYCGVVSAFVAPTASAKGSITLGTTAQITFDIPAGSALASVPNYACVSLVLDASGDAIVSGPVSTPSVQVGGSLPSTTTLASGPDAPLLGLALPITCVILALCLSARSGGRSNGQRHRGPN